MLLDFGLSDSSELSSEMSNDEQNNTVSRNKRKGRCSEDSYKNRTARNNEKREKEREMMQKVLEDDEEQIFVSVMGDCQIDFWSDTKCEFYMCDFFC